MAVGIWVVGLSVGVLVGITEGVAVGLPGNVTSVGGVCTNLVGIGSEGTRVGTSVGV